VVIRCAWVVLFIVQHSFLSVAKCLICRRFTRDIGGRRKVCFYVPGPGGCIAQIVVVRS
jgi:hypothetical protein